MKFSHAAFAFKVRQIWGILYTRLPCLYILEFSNKKTKYLKLLLPETEKMSGFSLWREVPLCIVLLKYSPNLALDQQDRKNPLSIRSLVKDNCSVENPQNVHTREAKVHSPVESMRSSLAHINFLWKALWHVTFCGKWIIFMLLFGASKTFLGSWVEILTPASRTPWSWSHTGTWGLCGTSYFYPVIRIQCCNQER